MARVSPVTLFVGVAGDADRGLRRLDRSSPSTTRSGSTRRASDIVDNAAPSIAALAAARTDMRRLELGVGRF